MGIVFGVGTGLLCAANHLNKSNNFGDSTGDLKSFSNTGIVYYAKQNRVNRKTGLDDINSPIIKAGLFERNKNNEANKGIEEEIKKFEADSNINPFKPLTNQ